MLSIISKFSFKKLFHFNVCKYELQSLSSLIPHNSTLLQLKKLVKV